MDRILEEIPHSSVVDGDDDRISIIIQELIDAGEVKAETAFVKESESKRVSRKTSAQREADEASTLRDQIFGVRNLSLVRYLRCILFFSF